MAKNGLKNLTGGSKGDLIVVIVEVVAGLASIGVSIYQMATASKFNKEHAREMVKAQRQFEAEEKAKKNTISNKGVNKDPDKKLIINKKPVVSKK